MCEVAVSCEAYAELQIILDIRSGIVVAAHLSSIGSFGCRCTLMYILCHHIDGHVRLYPHLAMCAVLESCEFNS